MKLNQGIIYTNDNCIGCNRCISCCPVMDANISVTKDGRNYIYVDDDKCLHCGRCLDTCRHNARVYRDDTDNFLADLAQGESISLLVAPSFFVMYESSASQILGYLKHLGVRLIYDVSFGADIATWAYLSYLTEHPSKGSIAPPCSAVVNYIQKYSKVLFDKIIPVYTPLLCLAVYLRKYLNNTDKLAFLSPCIAKKDEISSPANRGLVQYNVTFMHLLSAIDDTDLSSFYAKAQPLGCGLGRIYPTPGGLAENMRLFIEPENIIRDIHGEENVYEYFSLLEQRILQERELPYLVDCLNCRRGCLSGTATASLSRFNDDVFFRLQKRRLPDPAIACEDNPYLSHLTVEERRRRLFARFSSLSLSDFICRYDDSKYQYHKEIPAQPEITPKIDAIFLAMHKKTPESRAIDCHSCGYGSCLEMATAIAGGYNRIENCIHFVKDENLRISMLDARTGIPNFNAFLNFTEGLIQSEQICNYTAICFNIMNFKFINYKYGFKRGDLALKEYAISVFGLTKGAEIVAMIGGDDFIGIFKSAHLPDVLHSLQSIPLYTLSDDAGAETVYVSARIAIYKPDGSDTSPQMLVEKLSFAYNAISKKQRPSIVHYDDALREKALWEDMMIDAIEPALSTHEFEVYYQPKVCMATRKLVGAEALIRWNRSGALISPMDFIPVCEKMGFIQKLDFYILDEVCRTLTEWIAAGIPVVPISVNFSKQHFVEDTVADRINRVADKWNIPKELLEIEFTETAYLNSSNHLSSSIDKLHAYGISSSMDDFGTGYSSLSMLQHMSFNTLKLDKSFLHDGNFREERNRTVIENIIRMAKQLNMSIVSEGIETEEELEYMKELNCDIAQGYLFDRPLPRRDFEQRLLKGTYPF